MCIEPLFYFFKYKYISIYFKCNNNSQHLSQEHIHINFCLMHSIPLYSWCTVMNLTSLLWIDSCFQSLAIINVTATDSLAHISLCTCTNLAVGVVHRVGIAGWNDMLIAMYISHLHSHQQYQGCFSYSGSHQEPQFDIHFFSYSLMTLAIWVSSVQRKCGIWLFKKHMRSRWAASV